MQRSSTLKGILIVAGLFLLIFGIPMSYIMIKDYIREVKWENRKEERRPKLEAAFAPVQKEIGTVYLHLNSLAHQIERVNPFSSYQALPDSLRSLIDSLSQLPEGISPFIHPFSDAPPQLSANAFFGLAKNSHQPSFIYEISDYCGQNLFYRVRQEEWEDEAYHDIVDETKKDQFLNCFETIAQSKYLLVWHELYHQPAISSSVSFTSGMLLGKIDVYDIQQKKKINTCYTLTRNSDTVYSFTYGKNADKDEEMKKSLKRDLLSNTKKLITKTFGSTATQK
ncbi:MAG: hypothetical protein ACPGJS_08060 [Flammeovirgaceae bacterium]